MKFFFTVFSLSVFVFTSSYSQTLNVKKLDSLFDLLNNRGLASGSLAISVNGKIAYQKTVGFTLLDSNKKFTPDVTTQFRIGSVSKMFTAVLIFQLIEEGKLSLDEKLATYFPTLPNAGKITMREMLYHRSGLHDYTVDTNFPQWKDNPKKPEELLQVIAAKGSDFEPGTRVEYCNTNYLLLSYIIEQICNMPYGQAITEKINSKIDLKNTCYSMPIDSYGNKVASYKYADGEWKKERATDVSIHKGAGSLVSTPSDLTAFIRNLFEGRLVSLTSLDSMKTIIDGYGMGMFPYDFNATKGYGHNGRIDEFYSAVRYFPEKKLAVSYITNGILFPRTDILEGVLKICFKEHYQIPFSEPGVLQSSGFDKYLGTYASGSLPFKVTCKKKDGILIFEAAGKSMDANPVAVNYFMNLETGSFFQFNPEKGELQIKETDNIYYLQKER